MHRALLVVGQFGDGKVLVVRLRRRLSGPAVYNNSIGQREMRDVSCGIRDV